MRFTPLIFAASAAAYYTADTSADPSGNAIALPGLNDLVPAGETYTITWDPTTTDNVSLVLLRGPSTNVVYLETIVDSIENTGSYDWSVPTSLEPDTTHYGIELTCADGAYQYSTQFGISNDAYSNDTSSVVASSTVPVSTGYPMTATGGMTYSTGGAHLGSSSTNGSFTFATSTVTSTARASSGASSSSTSSSAASSSSAVTGAAGKTGLSIGAVVAVAGFAAALM